MLQQLERIRTLRADGRHQDVVDAILPHTQASRSVPLEALQAGFESARELGIARLVGFFAQEILKRDPSQDAVRPYVAPRR